MDGMGGYLLIAEKGWRRTGGGRELARLDRIGGGRERVSPTFRNRLSISL